MANIINEEDVWAINFILYEDEDWIDTIEVLDSSNQLYDFTGASVTMYVDTVRPRSGDPSLTWGTGTGEITLTDGKLSINGTHGLTETETGGTPYEVDCLVTAGGQTFMLFKGTVTVKINV